MTITRRTLMQSVLAAGAVLAAPSILRAQDKQAIRMIMGDIQIFDPVFTTSQNTFNHAMAVYDTLFALDADLVPQPQMVGNWSASDDKKAYTFELRDGLSWHDRTPVTAADCVASIRRWGQVEPSGQLLLKHAANIVATNDRTFVITLNEAVGSLTDILAKPLFMMREQDAKLPATEQVTTNIGSGPYKFNAELTRPARALYMIATSNMSQGTSHPAGLPVPKLRKPSRSFGKTFRILRLRLQHCRQVRWISGRSPWPIFFL